MAPNRKVKAAVSPAPEQVFGTEGWLEKVDKARMATDLLKTLVVAHAARTGAGFNNESLVGLAKSARLAVEELVND